MLGLYFYRARQPTLTADADLRDKSCRPDPDFEWLTLGLCRPGLRKRIARLAAAEPVEVLFYSRVVQSDILLLVVLAHVGAVYDSHADAHLSFDDGFPRSLVVRGNPCLFGTEVDPAIGRVTARRRAAGCACDRYVRRAGTPYLRLAAEPSALRLDDPVPVRLRDLQLLSPHTLRLRWPPGTDLSDFQRATQNGAHWIRHPGEVEAVRRYFLDAPRSTLPTPRQGRTRRIGG